MIDTELPDDANRVQVELFMRQHAQGEWGFDSHDHEFWGWLPQSQLDKVRMDRRVKITIEMNRGTDTVKRAYVETFFTFL